MSNLLKSRKGKEPPYCLGSVLFGFYGYQGSVQFVFFVFPALQF